MVGLLRLAPGAVFARDFEVRELLGEGGMGTVYAVLDRASGQERALKVLLPELVADETSRRRFAQEARIGAQIESPHVPRVHGAGIDEETGMPFIVMDLLRGRDLRVHVRERGALPLEEARTILEQLGDALAAAHAKGLVHRDLKPENVYLEETGGAPRVMLLDFGVAKIVDMRRSSATGTAAIGSPLWMAPEQTSVGGRIAPSSDVFAYGLLAYYVLTGSIYWRSAHDHSSVGGLMRELHVDEPDLASVRAAQLGSDVCFPPGFDAWFARCVVREPSSRFRAAGDALAALRLALVPGRAADHSAMAYARTMEIALPANVQALRSDAPGPSLAAPIAPQPREEDVPPTDPPPPLDAVAQRSAAGEAFQPELEQRESWLPARRRWPWLVAISAVSFVAAALSALIVWVILTITGADDAGGAALEAGPWIGSYTCDAETVPTTIELRSVESSAVSGSLVRTQNAQLEELALAGTWDASTARLVLHTPPGTRPRGLDGNVDVEGAVYRGRVIGRDCGRFVLRRASR